MSSIAIFGAGGHAKVIVDIAEQAGIKIFGIFDDNSNAPKSVLSYSVLGGAEELIKAHAENPDLVVVIAIGNNTARKRVVDSFSQKKIRFATLIHPSAIISKHSQIAEGTVVMAGVVVNASTDVGAHTILNTRCSVDHDCKIGSFVHVAPGATLCGNVKVDEGALVGVGGQIAPNISIGSWSVIGAGSTVINNISCNLTVVGSPARIPNK